MDDDARMYPFRGALRTAQAIADMLGIPVRRVHARWRRSGAIEREVQTFPFRGDPRTAREIGKVLGITPHQVRYRFARFGSVEAPTRSYGGVYPFRGGLADVRTIRRALGISRQAVHKRIDLGHCLDHPPGECTGCSVRKAVPVAPRPDAAEEAPAPIAPADLHA